MDFVQEFTPEAQILAHHIRDEFKKRCANRIDRGFYDPIDLVCFTLQFIKHNPNLLNQNDIFSGTLD